MLTGETVRPVQGSNDTPVYECLFFIFENECFSVNCDMDLKRCLLLLNLLKRRHDHTGFAGLDDRRLVLLRKRVQILGKFALSTFGFVIAACRDCVANSISEVRPAWAE